MFTHTRVSCKRDDSSVLLFDIITSYLALTYISKPDVLIVVREVGFLRRRYVFFLFFLKQNNVLPLADMLAGYSRWSRWRRATGNSNNTHHIHLNKLNTAREHFQFKLMTPESRF